MEKKKMVILICATVAIVLVVVVIVAVLFLKPKDEAEGYQLEGNYAGEMGIGYGGDFNEFDTAGKVDQDVGIDEETDDDTQEMVDLGALIAEGDKAKEEFEKNLPGDIIGQDGSIKGAKEDSGNTLKPNENIADTNEGAPGQKVPVGDIEYEENEDGELVLTPMESTGYAEYEVLCDATSMEEAEAVAEQISGTVIELREGIATIQISVHVDELLAELESQGSTLRLYRKYYYSIP